MDRRVALKNLGLSMGYVIAAPTFLSVVQSCKDTTVENWTPILLSKQQGTALGQILDVLLPKTEDSPSATEAKVHIFMDEYYSISKTDEEKAFFKMRIDAFMDAVRKKAGKDVGADVTPADIELVLAFALKPSDAQNKANNEAIKTYMDAINDGKTATLNSDAAIASLANELRSFGIYAYKSSEIVAKNHLAYNPIPGTYIACGSVEELTGGKAWYQ